VRAVSRNQVRILARAEQADFPIDRRAQRISQCRGELLHPPGVVVVNGLLRFRSRIANGRDAVGPPGQIDIHHRGDGRQNVDGLYIAIADRAFPLIRRFNQEWNRSDFYQRLVGQTPEGTTRYEAAAVVGGYNDQGPIVEPDLFQSGHELPEESVDIAYL